MKPALPTFPALLQRFFTQRLMQQKRVSAHTIGSYRDTFRLLLRFAQDRLRTSPDQVALEMIDAPFISAFLNELRRRGALPRAPAIFVSLPFGRSSGSPPMRCRPITLKSSASSLCRPNALTAS